MSRPSRSLDQEFLEIDLPVTVPIDLVEPMAYTARVRDAQVQVQNAIQELHHIDLHVSVIIVAGEY